jgi:hypothetical protein
MLTPAVQQRLERTRRERASLVRRVGEPLKRSVELLAIGLVNDIVSKAHAVLTSLLALVLLQPSFAQTGKVAIIHTEEFFHPERGIKRLIRALKELDQDFYSRPFEAQEKQFLEINKICFPEGLQIVEGRERVKEIVCPVLEDVSKRAGMFAKKRKIRQMVDIHDEVGLFKVDKLKDLTREFINYYNYRNP